MTTTLKRLSICSCGFPCLNESIKLGAVNDIDPEDTHRNFHMKCGGCPSIIRNILVVRASQFLNPEREPGYLPYELFL